MGKNQIYNPNAPWDWNIYLHEWLEFMVNVLVNMPVPWSIWVRQSYHNVTVTVVESPLNHL